MPLAWRRKIGRQAIVSPSHPVAQVYRRGLASGATREGWLAIEGPILFAEALQAGGYVSAVGAPEKRVGQGKVRILSVIVTEDQAERFDGALQGLQAESEIILASERLFSRVSQTKSPQGIAALVELPERRLEWELRRPNVLAVVACGLQDPGNLGAIMRSAQALGASALLTLQNTVSPFNPKAVRSSAGAVLKLPLFTGLEPESLFERLRALSMRIVAADRYGSVPVQQADLRGSLAVLIGKEAAGLEDDWVRGADIQVAISIRSDADSLNAAMAGSIFLYEAARQRGFYFDESV